MTTPYIDPNLIFAENAPVQDKPAAFSNYNKGWDESRNNDGRPLIPQMNYLHQKHDLQNLYIHENGAALPYKDGIAYEENAVVVKDGVLQQWKGGVWVVVKPSHNDLSGRDVAEAHPASAILDGGGQTQQEINNNQESVNTILNKTGTTETLAESVDATPFLQSLINAMPDGMTLDLLGKTFRVKKNTGFASDYPNGDQPCLVIKDKKNITITNGKLIVKEHAQTAIDCISSTGTILGLTIQGAGNFPPLYGTTGRGEKGLADAGYFNEALYNSGQPRNNSVDTSAYTGGNYGANGFPQWGGGYASTWGVWNGGYIFNVGDGIYLKNSDFKIEACDIYGFNGNCVAIAEGSVTLERNKLHDCYSAGFFAKAHGDGAWKTIKSVYIENNEIYDMGHPDSQVTDFAVDPGYGVSTSNNSLLRTGVERYTVINNTFKRCKRKAIDAHHAFYTNHSNNIIEDCGFGVNVTITTYGVAPESLHVNNNLIKNTRQSIKKRACGVMIDASNTNSPYTGTAHVCNNTVVDVGMDLATYNAHKAGYTGGGIGIGVLGIENAIIIGNSVLINPNFVSDVGITDNLNTTLGSPRSTIIGNTVRGPMLYGIVSRQNANNASNAVLLGASTVIGNVVDITPKVDIPSGESAYAIFTDKATTTKNNSIVQRPNVQKYSQPNLDGCRVTFDLVMATGTVSNIVNSELTNFTAANFVVTKLNNNFLISVPQYKSMSILERATPATASVYGVRYESGASTSTSIALSLYSNVGGSAVTVDASTITRGILRITLELM